MEVENIFNDGYSGGKQFSQHQTVRPGGRAFGTDDMSQGIDLNEQLVRNKPATFFMRVSGNSMVNAGIFSGDIAIVDRSVKPVNGKIVIAVINGEMLIRRYERTINKLRLVPETPRLATIDVSEFSDFKIWGVVVHIVRSL